MWHKFLQNQWNKILLGLVLCLAETLTFSFVGELNTLLTAERNRFFEKNNFLNYSPALKKDLQNTNNIKLDEDFLISTLLRLTPTHRKFINYKDQCSLYAYLISGLANNALGEVKSLAINYQKDGKLNSSIISINDFYDLVVKPACPKTLPFSQITTITSFKKSFEKVKTLIPDEAATCREDYSKILYHPQVFNLCSTYEQTLASRQSLSAFKLKANYLGKIRKTLDKQDRFFLDNLCMTQKTPKQFCKDIFEADYWQKVSQGKSSPHITPIYCGTRGKDLKQCLRKLNGKPEICHYPKYLSTGIVPNMNCQLLSLAFNHSHFNTEYPECPLQIENLGIVAASRLLNHIEQGKYEMSPQYCVSYPLSKFMEFNFEYGNALAWDYQLCYFDKIDKIDRCYPSIIGSLKDYKYSQDLVITQILQKNGIISENQSCNAIDEDEYNPNLLKYKSGCYILGQLGRCSLTKCDFKILYNEKEIDIVKIKPAQNFDYVSSSRDYRNFSQIKLITEQLKKSSSEIRNLSVLKNFFKNHPKDIIHGVGCAESILPQFFSVNSLNQCEPLPFIIDGYVIRDGESLLVTRTSLDHLHAPRLIHWQKVYSAVKTMHDLHPQKLWSLNGFY